MSSSNTALRHPLTVNPVLQFMVVLPTVSHSTASQGHGRDPITSGVQYATGWGARQAHLGSLPCERFDQMFFQGSFESGLFENSVILPLKPAAICVPVCI